MRRSLLVALVAAALALGACSSAEPEAAPTPPPPSPSPSATPTPPPTWPLTGLPADRPVTGPVLVVKVDNTASAMPQLGLQAADLVVEETVEGGVTRLAVMLQSQLGGHSAKDLVLGPVRSLRSSDVGIVKPTGGVIVASGGAPPALADVQAAGIETRLEGSPGFYRDFSRPAPYNLFARIAEVKADVGRGPVGKPYLRFDEDATLPQGRKADTLVLQFSPAHSTTLERVGQQWQRSGMDDGYEIDTVVALVLQTVDAGYLDPGGNAVPELVTTGSGNGWIAHGNRVMPIRWTKDSASSRWTFTTRDGSPVAVPAGHVYLALMPAGTAAVTPMRSS
jgi:hypothetical protein